MRAMCTPCKYVHLLSNLASILHTGVGIPTPPPRSLFVRSFINRRPPTPSRWSRSRFRLTIAERSGRDSAWAPNSVIELQGDVEGALETVEGEGSVGDRDPRVHPRECRLRGTRNWGMTGFLKGPSDVLIYFFRGIAAGYSTQKPWWSRK